MNESVYQNLQPLGQRVDQRLLCGLGVSRENATPRQIFEALSQVVREQLAQRWALTQQTDRSSGAKRVYYLSMEFLIGRTLNNALDALNLHDEVSELLAQRGLNLTDTLEFETDAALGNGGLGRLAACFLDAMATLGLPSWGYGMRYEYGMFAQSILDGRQIEHPDPWLADGTPWEFPRPEADSTVSFGGRVETVDGRSRWIPADAVIAKAYDMVIPGYGTDRVSTLRLWKATAPAHIDLDAFNQGDYARAAEFKNRFENISWVLYPNDSTPAGRELRLRQEYFFVSASLQDIVARHLRENPSLLDVSFRVAIHLNDTHPAIAVPELMRILVDEHGMAWNVAWEQCLRVFSYTNHTLMPEALETWSFDLMRALLPRHVEIILQINQRHLEQAAATAPGDGEFIRRLSIIDETGERRIRMAHLSIVGSHKINGVSQLHSDLMQQTIFSDFARLYPGRFTNKTNGVTPRRWVAQANRPLASLLDGAIGPGWRLDLEQLARLTPLAEDAGFTEEFARIKRANRARLTRALDQELHLKLDPASLMDVQIKRIHEYKRQLLNLLHVITRYNTLSDEPGRLQVPRTVLFAGKAASSYVTAKQIIRLVHDVAAVVNADPRTRNLLQVVFVPNYGVSKAELIVQGADLSQQISTAGTEASGTGNMKLALNGALTIGTEDGANIEIRDSVGAENIFIFGHSAAQVDALRRNHYSPWERLRDDPRLARVIDQIRSGAFSPGDPGRYTGLVDHLLGSDHYLLLADYADYVAAQDRVDGLYADPHAWTRKAVRNVAGMGRFSADRTIREYAVEIWGVVPQA